MSQSSTTGTVPQAAIPAAGLAQWAFRRETGVVLLCVAILQQSLGHHNADNSWLIHVCERLLDGARIYVDPIETNPPASFLIYLPAVALARLLRLPSEFMVSLFVFAGALAGLGFCATLIRRAKLLSQAARVFFFNAGVFALLLVPGICFAQREHIAVIAMLPMLIVFAARAAGEPIRAGPAAAAGALAGCAVAIKPFFVAALALPFLLVLWRQRRLALLWRTENIAAAATIGAYAVSVVLLFPEFFAVLPALLDTYVPVKAPLKVMLLSPLALIAAALIGLCVFVCRNGWRDRGALVPVLLILGAVGFMLAALAQGKGWINHFLPAIVMALIALAASAAPQLKQVAAGEALAGGLELAGIAGLAAFTLLLPLVFGAPNQFAMQEEYPGLRAAIAKHAPPRPKIMTLAVGLDAGFPITRQVGGEWVGRQNMLWQMAFARILLDRGAGDRAKMQGYIDASARMFAEDVRKRRPDVIVAGKGPVIDKIWRRPAIAGAMAQYRRVANLGEVELWAPQDQ